MSEISSEQWAQIQEKLCAPFAGAEVEFRLDGNPTERKPGQWSGRVVAYVDRWAIIKRLNDVVGIQNWTFVPTPIVVEHGAIMVAMGTLTIHGVSKSDVGDASKTEPTKGCISDALKRAAHQWGMGAELADLRTIWAECEPIGKSYRVKDAEIARLRRELETGRLGKSAPSSAAPSQQSSSTSSAQSQQQSARTAPSTQQQPPATARVAPAEQPQPQPQPTQPTQPTRAADDDVDLSKPASAAVLKLVRDTAEKAGWTLPPSVDRWTVGQAQKYIASATDAMRRKQTAGAA